MAPAKKKQKLTNGEHAVTDISGIQNEEDEHTLDTKSSKDGADQQRRSLFVRSLPPTTTTDSLTELFSESYPIKHATAIIDPATKQCRGYGFVTFADVEDAQKAREEFNGYLLDGKRLRIEIAEPRHRDAEKSGVAETVKAKRQSAKEQQLPQPSRLIVRNLPWTIKTSEQLSKLFMSYGKIKQAYIPTNKHGQLSGFGFVVLRGRKNAEKALEGINGKQVDGRTLAVDWAVSKDVYEDLLKNGTDGVEDAERDKATSEHQDAVDGASDDALRLSDEDSEDGSSTSEIDDEVEFEDEADVEIDNEDEDVQGKKNDTSSTLFVRNLPFTCTDEVLEDQFAKFGKTRYARVVMDANTERSKGTGFVCFYSKSDADACLRDAPRPITQSENDSKDAKAKQAPHSILQNEANDPSGNYTIDGRVLQISRAVDRTEADRLTQEGVAHRRKRNDDRRRLYLLSEGTISSKSKLWEKLSITERNMRDASAKQRKTLIESNPSLHLSLTRLSVRNIPRNVTSKDLKSLAREAVVGFATDVKNGTRQKLSKEELARGGEEMQDAEKGRKKTGKGVVRQAKVVFEGAGGSKVSESSGAGRSRGYGFIEFYTHRCALMGLRWLNGHAIGYQVKDEKKAKATKEQLEDRKKRLIVEFAIENAQVVLRRKDREQKARDRSAAVESGAIAPGQSESTLNDAQASGAPRAVKRKRVSAGDSSRDASQNAKQKRPMRPLKSPSKQLEPSPKKAVDEKIAQRNRVIGRKRAMRRNRKGAKA